MILNVVMMLDKKGIRGGEVSVELIQGLVAFQKVLG